MHRDQNMPNQQREHEHPLTQERVMRWGKGGVALLMGLAATTAAWLSLGLPVPATTAYVVTEVSPVAKRVSDLEQYAQNTREIVLRGRQGALLEEIEALKNDQISDPDNRHLHQLIKIKEAEVRAIEEEISKIEKDE